MKRIFNTAAVWQLPLFLLLILLPLQASPAWLFFATDALIAALLAISLNLLVGYGGMVSFGHAAYYGVGAYACALLMKSLGWPLPLALLGGVALSVMIAAFAGFFCVRLTAVYFSMLTLAFSQIVWAVCFRWNEVTGGDQGLSGVPMPDFSWIKQVAGQPDFDDGKLFYWLALVIVALCTGLAWMLVHSPFGRVLIATRENPQRCTFIGLNVRHIQLAAFCIAAALAAVAGGLFGVFNRGVYPDFVVYSKGAEILIMVLLGGSRSFWGPALGAVALLLLHQESPRILEYVLEKSAALGVKIDLGSASASEYWGIVLGLVVASLTLMFPAGISGLLNWLRARFKPGGGAA
ncbi:branched-chain amino acid ABC transporter permease [Massilia sp. W12]|uniref:branched-chain amino acid ABC transporter permease n=1 Tax=Massilia sp. W12 TaxID=3126507 RepID=UPI0030CD5C85